ncbi:MAG: hypothetical protein HS115_03225 [Spirochaetales bacterium]|nr:hypothetical protein [Spirochaetales bacterium]
MRAPTFLLCFALTCCQIGDSLDIQLPDSLKGKQAGDLLENTIAVHFLAGGRLFCDQFTTSICHDNLGSSLAEAAILAGQESRKRLGLEATRSYPVPAIKGCQDRLGLLAQVIALTHLDSRKTCNAVGCSPPPAGEPGVAALSLAALSVTQCRLEPGALFSAGFL